MGQVGGTAKRFDCVADTGDVASGGVGSLVASTNRGL